MTTPTSTPTPKRPEPLLSVKNLRVEYYSEARTVIGADDVSFSIDPGEVFGLAGESGCGKSTVANTIMCLLQPPARVTSGSITFRGQDILALEGEELRKFRWQEIAMVFQSAMNSLSPVMTIGDQIIDVFTAHKTLDRRRGRDRAGELLELVGIKGDRLKSYPHQLSGGMRQRVVIALALALNPSMLIMDEPTTALDVVVQQEIMQQIKGLQQEFGFAVLFITHDISLMVELSHRMGIMYRGRLVEMADAGDIFAEPLHPYTKALMGAFPPLTGPRRKLTGLSDAPAEADGSPRRLGFDPANIPDLTQVRPGRWVAMPDHEIETSQVTPEFANLTSEGAIS
jgi:peptide/nickel transport system ATP-binding protein